jgi:negative regulator of sigma E activity
MTMHEQWTDRLSEYLDGELPADEASAVEAHLRGCQACAAVMDDLNRVVMRAQAAAASERPPRADLWAGIAERIDAGVESAPSGVSSPRGHVSTFEPRTARRISFTLPQLAAAAVVVAAVSGGLAWQLRPSLAGAGYGQAPSDSAAATPATARAGADRDDVEHRFRGADAFQGADNARIETVGLADAQYDAAVADLEKALKTGRGRLDASTIAIVEHNLQIIDQAISQAREALVADPANSYLSSHLVEARRRKLDLLRRAAALTTDMD